MTATPTTENMNSPTPTPNKNFPAAGVTAASAIALAPHLFAQSNSGKTIVRASVIGCGGRGTGAAQNFIDACKILDLEPQIVAAADAFQDRADAFATKFKVPKEATFVGYDSYHKLLEVGCDVVIHAAPPGFRPAHVEATVKAGRHMFVEKPFAVDPVGCRHVMDLGKEITAKGLSAVAGTIRRRQNPYATNKALIDAGAIGEIRSGVIARNTTVPWTRQREPGWSDADYITRNWVNFTELSGDHLVEQHIHEVDVMHWYLNRIPVSALAYGGDARRPSGNQFDYFSTDYDFGDGVHIHSHCRQMSGTFDRLRHLFTGSEGAVFAEGKLTGKKIDIPEIKFDSGDPYVQEHVDLLRSIIEKKPLNEIQVIAESTMIAIMGRISAYTGNIVRWVDLMENKDSPYYNLTCKPTGLDFEKGPITLPEEKAPIPGKA